MIKILLADDDDGLRRVIQFKLKQNGYDVTAVSNGLEALNLIDKKNFDLLLTDLKMPEISGLDLLEKVKSIKPQIEVIMMTAYGEVANAVTAMKLGAFDFLTKPFEDAQLLITIEKALKFKQLEKENINLKKQLSNKQEIISGTSSAFIDLIKLIEKISPTDATVLIQGESGTGKEVFAKMIHEKSNRASSNFIGLNCAAIPRELLESELFGHTKGAFTGAIKDKKGKFLLANGGTLLLDEISELNIELQAKLLRAIQEKTIEPVGSEKQIEIDIRLVAATNTDLKSKVDSGQFREDLYFRLNVIPITVPPLRNRKEDIPIFIKGFLNKFSPDKTIELSEELLDILVDYPWPGNIRQLENLIERMYILRRTDYLNKFDLPEDFYPTDTSTTTNLPFKLSEPDQISFQDAERTLIIEAMTKAGGNKSKASRLLKIPRHILIYRLKKYNLS
jgi:two-component system NtrC family response regulator